MTNRNSENVLAASALALEAAAVALLWASPPSAALLAALAHTLGVACAAAFLARRAARLHLDQGGPAAWLLFATTSAVLPVIGPAALVILMRRVARHPDLPEPALVRAALSGLTDGVAVAVEAASAVGQGSLEARLRFDPAPASRIATVLATRRLQAADATRLLKLALRDRSEDVRLLAHALLEDRDRQAFRRIEEIEAALAATTAERRGPTACALAEALYDLCLSGLVSGEIEAFTLRRARSLLEEARASLPASGSAAAALLLARVLLRQGSAGEARVALQESGGLGAPSALLAPCLAEAAFQARQVASGKEHR